MWFILTSVVFLLAGVFALVNADVRNIENGRETKNQPMETTTSALSN
jgi:Tfp pilus assembly protein PilV